MVDLLLYVFLFAVAALVALAGWWIVRGQGAGQSPMVALFGVKPEKRLAIVEHTNLDGRRRLVLIRRDGIEHLIMTGGPVDVVIETGIGAPAAAPIAALAATESATNDPAQPAFGRRARGLARNADPQEAAQ